MLAVVPSVSVPIWLIELKDLDARWAADAPQSRTSTPLQSGSGTEAPATGEAQAAPGAAFTSPFAILTAGAAAAATLLAACL